MPFPLPPGSRLYFPNVVFRLVRSPLPPHQAVFKVPPQLSKLDIRDYLQFLYSIQVTDVRTMNYTGKTKRDRRGQVLKKPDFKKAIVTMAEDFVFPGAPDPKKDGALEMPPQPGFGKNSGRRIRDKIKEYNDRRGFVPEEQKAVEPTSGSSGSA